MKFQVCFWGLSIFWVAATFTACNKKPKSHFEFTKADSLTETYLSLQDTMLQVWNTMIHDDNRKVRAMHHLLHELSVSNPEKAQDINSYGERLDDLLELRYDQQSISDPEIVAEYDFASNSLVTEVIALAESQREFAYNKTIQKLVESIRAADQRVLNYRAEYDEVASKFNRFIDQHHHQLEDMVSDSLVVKKPLFEMAAE